MRCTRGCSRFRSRILTPRVADKKRYKRHVAFATLRPNGRPRPQTPFFTLVLSTFLLHLPPLVAHGRPWSPMPPQMPPDASQVPPRCLQMPPSTVWVRSLGSYASGENQKSCYCRWDHMMARGLLMAQLGRGVEWHPHSHEADHFW